MNKFTRQQKRIIAIASGMAACFLFFWVFVYAPQAKRVRAVKEEIARAETQIAEIKAITAGRDLVKAIYVSARAISSFTAHTLLACGA